MRFSVLDQSLGGDVWAIGFTKYKDFPLDIYFSNNMSFWVKNNVVGKLERAIWAMQATTFHRTETIEQSLAQARMEAEPREVLSSNRGC